MRHKYFNCRSGEEVKIVGVELQGPADNQEWMLTLSNGQQLSFRDFALQFDVRQDIEAPKESDMKAGPDKLK